MAGLRARFDDLAGLRLLIEGSKGRNVPNSVLGVCSTYAARSLSDRSSTGFIQRLLIIVREPLNAVGPHPQH
jgi:hypothetical protein